MPVRPRSISSFGPQRTVSKCRLGGRSITLARSLRFTAHEVLQVSSAAGSSDQDSELGDPSDVLWEVGLRAIESLLREPDLIPLQEPCDKTTMSGFSFREVVLGTPSGTLFAGFAVRGPRGVVIATLDAAPDHNSVNAVREYARSIFTSGRFTAREHSRSLRSFGRIWSLGFRTGGIPREMEHRGEVRRKHHGSHRSRLHRALRPNGRRTLRRVRRLGHICLTRRLTSCCRGRRRLRPPSSASRQPSGGKVS